MFDSLLQNAASRFMLNIIDLIPCCIYSTYVQWRDLAPRCIYVGTSRYCIQGEFSRNLGNIFEIETEI